MSREPPTEEGSAKVHLPIAPGRLAERSFTALKWNYFGAGIRILSQLAIGVILARLLGPEPFGLVAIAWFVVGLGTLISDLGFGSALIQSEKVHEHDKRYVFTILFLVALVTTIVVVSSAGLIAEFFRRPEVSMQVLLATPDSAFYEEETKMTLGADWTEERRKAAVEENRARVGHAQALLVQLAAGRPQALEMRHFDTQFRLPIIVIDEQCFLTVRLSPDEGAQSLRLEFEGAEGYGRSCIAHFDRMWSLSAPTALALPH